MRRLLIAILAIGALTAVTASPGGAQEIPDVPPLTFDIDPLEGPAGSVVAGNVNPDEVAEHCITDPFEFVSQFVDPENPLGGGAPAPYFDAVEAYVNEVFNGDLSGLDTANDPEAFATIVAVAFPLGLAANLPELGGDGALVEGAMDQTFVMAFADLATVSPIDPLGHFDAATGAGEVEVPDLAPGSHPVIATCVAIPQGLTNDDIANAITVGAAFVEANFTAPYPDDILDPEFAEAAGQVAPSMIRDLVEPQALGVQFFCVVDDAGACPGQDPGPGPGPGPDPGPGGQPGQPPTAPPAAPVTGVEPTFTG